MRLVSLLVATLLLAACGGSSDAAARPSARSLVLHPADLPAGWTATPHDAASDSYAKIGARFNRCVGSTVEIPVEAEHASSPDFAQANGARQVKSTVTLAGDGIAGPAVRNLSSPRAAGCLTEAFQTVLPGRQVERLSVRGVATAPLVTSVDADEVAALRTTLDLRLGTTDFTVYVDNVFVADGPWMGRLYLVGTGTPLDRALEDQLVSTLAERLAGA